jgi:hypothetical protein
MCNCVLRFAMTVEVCFSQKFLFLAKAQRRKGLFVIAKPQHVLKPLFTCVAEAI